MKLIILCDERPEEVTDSPLVSAAEIWPAERQRHQEPPHRQLAVERASGSSKPQRCVILLDSITRTARAFHAMVAAVAPWMAASMRAP